MSTRGIRMAVLLAAVLALSITATAEAALSTSLARKFAVAVAQKQTKEQKLLAYHLGKPKRVGANTVSFPYDYRGQGHSYCVTTLIVKASQSGNRRSLSAKTGKRKCIRVPADALAIEKAMRTTARGFKSTTGATKRAVARFEKSVKACKDVKVPKSATATATASALFDIAATNALQKPNDGQLTKFLNRLAPIHVDAPALKNGTAAWADYINVLRTLPSIPDPCATLKAWKAKEFAADESPIDLDAYRTYAKRAKADVKLIVKGATYLARVGVFPDAVVSFTPDGLLLRLKPKF
jgi:hypothetical protein